MLDESKPIDEEVSIVNNPQMPAVCKNSIVQCYTSDSLLTNGFSMEKVYSTSANEANVEQSNETHSECLPSTENYDPLNTTVNGIKFPKLKGELLTCKGFTTEGIIILTNYRLFLSYNDTLINPLSLPVGAIDFCEIRDLLFLHVHTKLARSLVCSFAVSDDSSKWLSRITDAVILQAKLDNLFCFKFFKASLLARNDDDIRSMGSQLFQKKCDFIDESSLLIAKEFKRMAFDLHNSEFWRISDVNKDFKLCPSYPRYLIVPKNISDTDLEEVAAFRYSHRIPTAVWRYRKNGCIISRSSQPEVGWLGWRNNYDENLLQSMVNSCYENEQSSKKLLIVDARSYAAAVANRAKGGGCECPEYYPCCEVQFMSLANIHSIRKSFNALRYICDVAADQINWLTLLDNSKWLNHISSLIKSASVVVNALHDEGRPVLVHCSDGWDRTPQIVALSELMLDPYYRTIDGFRVLVEREWCDFGHKFAERCGNAPNSDDVNERCPVFLQWLDCVHQLVRQSPCSFEFNVQYLEKLALHVYSCLFSTFVCNNVHERFVHQVNERTFSLWSYINCSKQHFTNYLYSENEQVLRPSYKIKHMFFWSGVYGPLASHSVINSSTIPNRGIYLSSANNSCDPKKYLNSDLKATDSDTNTNETESDIETVSSEKPSNLVKTQSCDNVNCLEDVVINSELSARTRHHSESDLLRSLCIINASDANDTIDELHNRDVMKYCKGTSDATFDRDYIKDSPIVENHDLIEKSVSDGDTTDQKSVQHCIESEQTKSDDNSVFDTTVNANIDSENDRFRNVPCEQYASTTDPHGSHTFNDLRNSTSDNSHCFSSQVCTKKSFPTRQSSEQQYCDEVSEINTSNGKHTRTPSSGCPATPNDDQCSDISASRSLCDSGMHQMFDIDGQVLAVDEIQLRLRQVVMQHKAEVESLRKDLYAVRLTLCQQINYCGVSWKTAKSNSSDHSCANDTHNTVHSENGLNSSILDNSWVNISQYQHNEDLNETNELLPQNEHSSVRSIEPSHNSQSFDKIENCRKISDDRFCRCVNSEESSLVN